LNHFKLRKHYLDVLLPINVVRNQFSVHSEHCRYSCTCKANFGPFRLHCKLCGAQGRKWDVYSADVVSVKTIFHFQDVFEFLCFRFTLLFFSWVIPRRLNFMCPRLGTLCLLLSHSFIFFRFCFLSLYIQLSKSSLFPI